MTIIKAVGKLFSINLKRKIKRFILNNIYFDRLNNTYDSWVINNFPDVLDIESQKNEIKGYKYKPTISIVVPVYNTPILFLHECIRSVLTQSYMNWELVLVDDASSDNEVRNVIKEYSENDKRIKYKFLNKNHHIAGATNEAIKITTGEFVGLFDHDDILWPNALYEVVKALNKYNDIDFLYTDEDKIVEEKSYHSEPFFKPDWNPQLLRTCNYITHFSVFKKTLLDKIGYENGVYNGAQDWDVILRATRKAKYIYHIPKVLYSWRVHDNSTAKDMDSKPYVIEAQKATIEADLVARGYKKNDFNVKQDKKYFAFWRTTFNVGTPKVSIIVTNRTQSKKISRNTKYKNCEYIIAKSYKDGFEKSIGEYIVFVERNIKVETKNWVETLLSSAIQDKSGAVGGLTMYKNKDYIYSAGVYINDEGKFAHILSGGVHVNSIQTLTRNIYVNTKRSVTGLSGLIMVKKDKMNNYGYKIAQDYEKQLIDISLWLNKQGYENIYDPKLILKTVLKFPKIKLNNKSKKIIYHDRLITIRSNLKTERCFYDDLVSYPEID